MSDKQDKNDAQTDDDEASKKNVSEESREGSQNANKKESAKSSRALKTDLNQLWKNTVDQFDEMKDLIVRSSTAGKARFDATLERRHREKAVLELGELVLAAINEGDIEAPKNCAQILEVIQKYDDDIAQHEEEALRVKKPIHAEENASPAEEKAEDGGPTKSANPPEVVDAKVQE
ncbi:MAG: hypothetical protein GY822_06710 [Deltaproteobacteria bacterium]|nr:hypothetical protein [Deltaproteobacteria bacterium]